MSKEKAVEFVLAFRQGRPDEAFIKRFQAAQSDDERFALYAEAAAAAGFDVTASDIRAALEELEAERKAKTQGTVQDLQALDDDDIDKIAGGEVYWSEHIGRSHKQHWG